MHIPLILAIVTTALLSACAKPGPALSAVEYDRICKGAISILFFTPIDDIKVARREGEVVYRTYTRKSDGTVWRNKCRIEATAIIWGSEDGRWRTDSRDEKLSFTLDRDARTFTVRQSFLDGSGDQKTFSLE
jgi:hypothetical protein